MDAATALKSAAARSSLLIAPAFDLVPLVFSQSTRAQIKGKQRRPDRCPSACLLESHPLAFSSCHLLLPPGSRCREDGQLFHNWVSGTIVIDERAPIEYADE